MISISYRMRRYFLFLWGNGEVSGRSYRSICQPVQGPAYVERSNDQRTGSRWVRIAENLKSELQTIFSVHITFQCLTHFSFFMMNLYTVLLKYKLVKKLYTAELAGLNYSCDMAKHGMKLSVNGYNQNLHYIVEALTECRGHHRGTVTDVRRTGASLFL